jgi:ABC-type multidrug transport system ATPase subunit
MLRDAPVLVLDEPTTGLDAGSTDRILEPLRRLMAGRATIVVSHNLATVREATEIVVLDGGRVVERGTHPQLLRLGGRYRELWRLAGLAQQQRDGARILHGNFPAPVAAAESPAEPPPEPPPVPAPAPATAPNVLRGAR